MAADAIDGGAGPYQCLDVAFAIDSVPAVFGVAGDPFIVFSSNIMAPLGLRAMYFLLAGLLDRFRRAGRGVGLRAGVRRRDDGRRVCGQAAGPR